MTVYSYRRVSLAGQSVQEDLSSQALLRQEHAAILDYCRKQGLEDPQSWEDRDTEWTENFGDRFSDGGPGMQLHSGDQLVVTSLERIFSSCHDALSSLTVLKNMKVALHVVDLGEEVTAEQVRVDFQQLLRSLTEVERRRAAERIRHVKRRQRDKGRYLGGSRPFGYMIHDNGRLIENPTEQKVVKRILKLREQGLSLRAIAAQLSTPMAPISFKTVQRVLQRHV